MGSPSAPRLLVYVYTGQTSSWYPQAPTRREKGLCVAVPTLCTAAVRVGLSPAPISASPRPRSLPSSHSPESARSGTRFVARACLSPGRAVGRLPGHVR